VARRRDRKGKVTVAAWSEASRRPEPTHDLVGESPPESPVRKCTNPRLVPVTLQRRRLHSRDVEIVAFFEVCDQCGVHGHPSEDFLCLALDIGLSSLSGTETGFARGPALS
jgi:hypothetical protein